MAVQHGTITGDAIHVPYAGTFANAAARTGATGFDSTQHGKLFRQLDDDSLWMLASTSPLTWKSLSPDKVASAEYADNAGYADSAGNAGTLNGKEEGQLNVNSANTANSATHATTAGSAPANGGTAWATTTTPNTANTSRLPGGGSWLVLYVSGGYVESGIFAGGSNVNAGSVVFAIRKS